MDAARYARRVRQRFGMSQSEFARRINVSLVTVRNWEQGKRSPTGAARALLRIALTSQDNIVYPQREQVLPGVPVTVFDELTATP